MCDRFVVRQRLFFGIIPSWLGSRRHGVGRRRLFRTCASNRQERGNNRDRTPEFQPAETHDFILPALSAALATGS